MTLARPVFPALPDWDFLIAAFGGGLYLSGLRIEHVASRLDGRLGVLAAPVAPKGPRPDGGSDAYRSEYSARHAGFWAARLARAGATVVPVLPIVLQLEAAEALEPVSHSFWDDWAEPLVDAAAALVVPPILSWDLCPRVWSAATRTLRAGKPVFGLSARQLTEVA